MGGKMKLISQQAGSMLKMVLIFRKMSLFSGEKEITF